MSSNPIRFAFAALFATTVGGACGQVVSTAIDGANSTIDGHPGASVDARPGSAVDAPAGAFCGNGVVDPGEQCDDMNSDNTDNCLSTCVDVTSSGATTYMISLTGDQAAFIANQLDVGNNAANQVMPNLPDGSSLQVWSNANQTFTGFLSDAGSPTGWDTSGGGASVAAPILNPGDGFIVVAASGVTLTFTGSKHVPSLPLTLDCGGQYNLLARQTVDSGDIDTLTGYLIAENANGAYNGYGELIWNGNGYDGYLVDSTSGTGWVAAQPTSAPNGQPRGLQATAAGPIAAPPELSVGQSAFVYCP